MEPTGEGAPVRAQTAPTGARRGRRVDPQAKARRILAGVKDQESRAARIEAKLEAVRGGEGHVPKKKPPPPSAPPFPSLPYRPPSAPRPNPLLREGPSAPTLTAGRSAGRRRRSGG